MTQCKGTTRAGDRCKRSAVEGSDFCSTHAAVQIDEPEAGGRERYNAGSMLLGLATAGVVLLGYSLLQRWMPKLPTD